MKKPVALLFGVAVASVVGGAPAAPPAGRFVLRDGNAVVVDTKTNLRWERTANATLRARSGGATYCGNLALGGGGWRMPTVKELLTIVDREETGTPKWPTAFFDGPVGEYWSSTTAYQDGAAYYFVDFATGASGTSDQSTRYVRCVK